MPWVAAAMAAMGAIIAIKQSADASKVAKEQGDIALAQGKARGAQIERQGDRLISTQIAASGAGGGIPTMGSDLELQLETARETRMRQLDEVYAGQLGQWGKDQEVRGHQMDMWSAGFKGGASIAGAFAGGGSVPTGRPEGVSGPTMADGSFYSGSGGFMSSAFGRTRRRAY